MGHAGVGAQHPRRARDQGRQRAQVAGEDGGPGVARDAPGERLLAGPGRHHHGPGEPAGDRSPALGRPAARRRRRPRMDDGGAGMRRGLGRWSEVEVARVGGDLRRLEQPAPAGGLVLVVAPGGLAAEGDEGARLGAAQQGGALRPAAVQVDGHIGIAGDRRQRGGQRPHAVDVVHGVGGVAQQLDDRRQRGRSQEHALVVGKRAGKAAQRRDGGEQVAQPQGAQDDEPHGQDGSVSTAMTSSRSSTPAGRLRAKTTAWAISDGSARRASAPGLYCSGRPSKKRVCIPPGISRVTPTRPAVSAARARVKPTTPNLLAQ
jgi:hypothetical protein